MDTPDFAIKYNLDTALAKGIRQVGIGKHGSKPLLPELVEECLQELESGAANDLQNLVTQFVTNLVKE